MLQAELQPIKILVLVNWVPQSIKAHPDRLIQLITLILTHMEPQASLVPLELLESQEQRDSQQTLPRPLTLMGLLISLNLLSEHPVLLVLYLDLEPLLL
jgi:hypothetical protein